MIGGDWLNEKLDIDRIRVSKFEYDWPYLSINYGWLCVEFNLNWLELREYFEFIVEIDTLPLALISSIIIDINLGGNAQITPADSLNDQITLHTWCDRDFNVFLNSPLEG